MIRRHVKRLPVLRGQTVVGVIARSDLLKGLLAATPRATGPHPDAEIKAAIQAELDKLDWAPRASVRVEVQNGAVTFDGAITDERLREGLKVIAENTPGCVSVHDHMAWIEPNSGFSMPLARGGTENLLNQLGERGRLTRRRRRGQPAALPLTASPIREAAARQGRRRRERTQPTGRRAARSRRARRPDPRRTALSSASARPPGRGTGAPCPGVFLARTLARLRSRSDAANSPNMRATASVGRSRPMQLTLVARSGNRRASATATRMSPIVSRVRTRVRINGGEGVEPLLDRAAGAGESVEACVSAHEALDDGGEQRLLVGKPGVDRGFSGGGRLGDFVDARALEAALEKNPARRVEDSLLDLTRKLARRPAVAHGPRPISACSRRRFHRSFVFHRASFTKTATVGICTLDLGRTLTKVNETEQFRFGDVEGATSGVPGHGAQESGPRPANVQGRAGVRNRLGQGLAAALRGLGEPQAGHYRLARPASEAPAEAERPAEVPEKTEPPAEKTERPSGPSEQEAKPEPAARLGREEAQRKAAQGLSPPASAHGGRRAHRALAGVRRWIRLLGLFLAFRIDRRRLHRGAPVRDRAHRSRATSPRFRSPTTSMSTRAAWSPRSTSAITCTALAQAQAQVAGAEAGIHSVDAQIATQDAQIAADPGAGDPGAGEHGAREGHLGTRPAARQSGLGDGSAGHDGRPEPQSPAGDCR